MLAQYKLRFACWNPLIIASYCKNMFYLLDKRTESENRAIAGEQEQNAKVGLPHIASLCIYQVTDSEEIQMSKTGLCDPNPEQQCWKQLVSPHSSCYDLCLQRLQFQNFLGWHNCCICMWASIVHFGCAQHLLENTHHAREEISLE